MKVINAGSGKSLTQLNDWDTSDVTVVGVNNVWRGTNKWDHLVYAGDYPSVDEISKTDEQQCHSREINWGFKQSYMNMANMPWREARVYLGLPIYFTAAYWSLYYLNPTVIGFIGFDMNYTPDSEGNTTFYGKGLDIKTRGIPDPFYQIAKEYGGDPNMMNVLFERLEERRGECKFYNLSDDPESLLPWDKISIEEFKEL